MPGTHQKFPEDSALGMLMAQLPRAGRLQWIGLRIARDMPMREVDAADIVPITGLVGDRYGLGHGAGGSGKRAVTLIQAEHLPAIAALSGHAQVDPALLRRNLVVSGIPLIALRERRFRIGNVLLEGTGECDPCSRMEAALGPGGFNAMRGHGGLTASVIEGGRIQVGDVITVEREPPAVSTRSERS
jgi:MOSC domain-containing protein YiiM